MRPITIVACSLLTACASIPNKPIVEIGAIDFPKGHVWIGLSDGSDAVYPVPLADYDKATCFKPKAWEQEKTYIKLLEQYANSCHASKEAGK